ncbi:PREDICTED: nucleoporin-like protein 2 [Galeopterus variegatus]|uniref:Nucleoporin NUP42 n=1 Tax=Galeopterus variegatus TaxID=482537 RepID=A0ABM0QA60_GALVR|nr:PREDICTED: nucleoporin-like protein 2 [Galeopterus variegatus]
MTICQFFLQGRCRFGDRCWNEHPGAGGAAWGRQQPQQQPSGSNRRGWNTTSQRYSSVIQPATFSKSTPWGGSRDQEKPSFSSFDSETSTNKNRGFGLSQNPFSSLSSDEQKDEKKLLEGIIKDMEVWESSGQWMFSVYSPMKKKANISGFTDISPEELRLEYHNFLTSNNLQSYLNSVHQLINQWRKRVNELRSLNTSTKVALLSEAKDEVNPAAPTFGFGSGQAIPFGSPGFPVNNSSSDNAQNFSFKTSSGFVTAPSGSPSVFGSPPAFGAISSASSAISTSTPTFGFGKPEITSAASFSFKSPVASSVVSPGFSGFPTSLAGGPFGAPVAPAFGSGNSVAGFGGPSSHSHSAFSKPSNSAFGNGSISTSLPVSNGIITTDNVLFTPKDQLTVGELEQFQSKKFTLGKIPLKPPPVELLNI